MAEDLNIATLREDINRRFCEAVNYLLERNLARNKNEIMARLGLYLGRLSLILGGKANASTDNIALLARNYGVSTEWILMGVGTILKDGTGVPKSAARESVTRMAGSLSLIPITALAGFNGIDEPGVNLDACVHYYVPEFAQSGANFLIRIQGNSMVPTFMNGDLVACRKLDSNAWIEFGEAYVIDGQQGVMIKRVAADPDHEDRVVCNSDNAAVPPFSIQKSEIRSLSRVIGVVRSV